MWKHNTTDVTGQHKTQKILHNLQGYVPFFFVLATLWGKWDLSSPTRDRTCAPCNERQRVLTTGPPRKFWCLFKDRYQTHWRGTRGEGNGKGVKTVMTHLRMNLKKSPLPSLSWGPSNKRSDFLSFSGSRELLPTPVSQSGVPGAAAASPGSLLENAIMDIIL